MIEDLDETIRQLLIAEMPIKNSEIDIKFDQPKRDWSARLNKPTINFFLYDLRENVVLRRHQWEQMPVMPTNGNGKNGNGNKGGNGASHNIARLKRTPFRVDCFYMMTAWANEPEDEHRLMSDCLLALFRNPVVPAERLAGSMKNQPYELQAALARHDKLTNPAEIWGALDNELRPSVSFVITLAFDPWAVREESRARTFAMHSGQAEPESGAISEDAKSIPSNYISGTVLEHGKPIEGAEIGLKGTGHLDTTDALGRFRLGSVVTGDYTLVVWGADGQPTAEREVHIPTTEGDYDIDI